MRRRPPEPGVAFKGWVRPGPVPPGGLDPETGETLSFLAGHFRIFQFERGHRFSADDLLTAWYATTCAPRIETALDLGSGIGSVAMLLAWKHPASRFVTVEAQAESLRLFRKSLRFNALEERFTAIAGDLRSPETWPLDLPPFDLVTGSPPYFPEGTVTQASHPQAVPARIEKRGSVPEYAAAAAPRLAPSGWFVFVYRAGEDRFVASGLQAAGLRLVRKRDVVFREGEGPRITLYAAIRQSALTPEAIPLSATPISEAPLVLRTRTGDVGKDYAALRLSMGFPPGDIAGTEGKEGSGTIATC